jgi:hypothetical protein
LSIKKKPDNIFSDVVQGIKNIPDQIFDTASKRQSKDRIDALKEYVPSAKLRIDN